MQYLISIFQPSSFHAGTRLDEEGGEAYLGVKKRRIKGELREEREGRGGRAPEREEKQHMVLADKEGKG